MTEPSSMPGRLLPLGFAILATAWLVPNHYYPWLAFHAEVTSAFGLTILTVASLAIPGPIEWSRLAVSALIVAIVPLVQASTGLVFFWGDAWMACLYLLGAGLAVTVGRRLVRDAGLPRVAKLLWISVVVAGIVSVAIAMCQWLMLPLGTWGVDLSPGGRPYGNLAQPNQLSTLLVLAVIGTLALVSMRVVGVATCALVLAFLTLGVAMTGSRTGWIQLGLLSGWIVLAPRDRRSSLGRWPALLLPLLLIAGSYAFVSAGEVLQLSAGRALEEQTHAGTRPVHWMSIADAILRKPVFGYGWNQVAVAQAASAGDHPASHEMIEHSHNIVLDLLVWNGIPLGLAIVSGFAWWLWQQIRSCRDVQKAALLMAIGVVGIHALLEFPLEYAYFLVPVALMAGMAEASSRSGSVHALPRWTAIVPALLAAILTVWTLVEYMDVEEASRLRRFEAAGIRGAESPKPVRLVLLTQHAAFFSFVHMRAERGIPQQQLDVMRRVAERFGYPPVLLRFALAAALNGRPDEATQTLRRLCRIHIQDRCREGAMAWKEAGSSQYPEVLAVPFPEH